VIIQTQNHKNFVLQRVLNNDYDGFYQKEISLREEGKYPPFTRLGLIETRDQKEENARGAASDFYGELKKYSKGLSLTPPAEAIIAKIKGFYRYQILIKSDKNIDAGGKNLRTAIYNSFIEFNRKSRYRDVRLTIDIDPQSIL
jgi:primosomal protein N' (replication factor Y)